jgi:hypothetical protein
MSSALVVVSSTTSSSSTTRAHEDGSEDEGIYPERNKRLRRNPPKTLAISRLVRNRPNPHLDFSVTVENYPIAFAEHESGCSAIDCQDESTCVRMSNIHGGRAKPCLIASTKLYSGQIIVGTDYYAVNPSSPEAMFHSSASVAVNELHGRLHVGVCSSRDLWDDYDDFIRPKAQFAQPSADSDQERAAFEHLEVPQDIRIANCLRVFYPTHMFNAGGYRIIHFHLVVFPEGIQKGHHFIHSHNDHYVPPFSHMYGDWFRRTALQKFWFMRAHMSRVSTAAYMRDCRLHDENYPLDAPWYDFELAVYLISGVENELLGTALINI